LRITKIAVLHKEDLRYADRIITPAHLEKIRSEVPGVSVVVTDNEQDLISMGLDAQVLLTWGMFSPAEYCRRAKALRWIHALSAGVDGLFIPAITELDVVITCTKGIHGMPISETVLAYILAFGRGFPRLFRQQMERKWLRYPHAGEAAGRTVGIVGLGSVGLEIGRAHV